MNSNLANKGNTIGLIKVLEKINTYLATDELRVLTFLAKTINSLNDLKEFAELKYQYDENFIIYLQESEDIYSIVKHIFNEAIAEGEYYDFNNLLEDLEVLEDLLNFTFPEISEKLLEIIDTLNGYVDVDEPDYEPDFDQDLSAPTTNEDIIINEIFSSLNREGR